MAKAMRVMGLIIFFVLMIIGATATITVNTNLMNPVNLPLFLIFGLPAALLFWGADRVEVWQERRRQRKARNKSGQ